MVRCLIFLAETCHKTASSDRVSCTKRDKLLVTYAQLSDVPDSAWEETEDCMTLMERVAGVLNGRGEFCYNT